MSLNDPVHRHALRYATEATTFFLWERYKDRFPRYFRFARIDVRPATDWDYPVPASLVRKGIVVERTRFEPQGCLEFDCLRLRDDAWNPCQEADGPRWVAIGRRWVPTCQNACRDHSLHAEWIQKEGRCVVGNPLKKMLAAAPAKAFERTLLNVAPRGLDVTDGTLTLNEDYCGAYGLGFADGDCLPRTGSWERALGLGTLRPAVQTGRPPVALPAPPPVGSAPPPAVPKAPRHVLLSSALLEKNRRSCEALASELGKEIGAEGTEEAVEAFLVERAPAFLEAGQMERLAVRLVVKRSVAQSLEATPSFRVPVRPPSPHELYGTVFGLLDALDAHAGVVLDRQTLADIDDRLDAAYYGGGVVRPELTPAYVWEHGVLDAGEDRFEFMADRVEEYLEAVRAEPPGRGLRGRPIEEGWTRHVFLTLAFAAVLLVLSFSESVHVWASVLFFAKVYFDL